MSDTWKDEHASDGIHVSYRQERKARPAGRDVKLFEADLALDEERNRVQWLTDLRTRVEARRSLVQ